MRGYKLGVTGILVMMGVAAGVAWAEEPALEVKPPEAKPILEAPSAPAPVVESPVATTNTPAPAEVKPPTVEPVVPRLSSNRW